MPRIRSIKPDFWKSENVASRLPGGDGRQARLLFVALWNFAEDHGVLRGNPAYVRSEILAYDDDVSAGDVARWLEMLEAAGFIARFSREGSTYIWIRGFAEHQRIEKPSKPTLPSPTTEEQARRPLTPGALREWSVSIRGALPESSPTPPEKERMEVEGEVEEEVEVEGRSLSAEPTAPLLQLAGVAEPQDAAEVVFTHWRKVMGKNARTAFDAKRRRAVEARLRDGYSVEDLKRAIDGCSVTPHNIGQNDRGERYDDLELICRDAAHVDRFKRNATDPPALKATGTHSKAPVRAESIQHSSETGHDPTF